MTAQEQDGKITVTGNGCARGEKHAVDECVNPVRSLTTTVRVCNREDTMVSVKSADPMPKGKMQEAMGLIRTLSVDAPVKIGAVIAADVFGTQIIATKEIL
jgi:CxxC motif-containing protein